MPILPLGLHGDDVGQERPWLVRLLLETPKLGHERFRCEQAAVETGPSGLWTASFMWWVSHMAAIFFTEF
jgi:hypothetical protein